MHHGLGSNICLIHRDIKPENILLSKDLVAKLADLGESRFYNRDGADDSATMTFVGTLYYVAPEIIRGNRYNEKVDVYSFGIMLNEMDTKVIPYKHGRNMFQKRLVIRDKMPLRPWVRWDSANTKDIEYIELATRCWSALPLARPSMEEVLEDLESFSVNKGNLTNEVKSS